jgi:hypothetical protein
VELNETVGKLDYYYQSGNHKWAVVTIKYFQRVPSQD